MHSPQSSSCKTCCGDTCCGDPKLWSCNQERGLCEPICEAGKKVCRNAARDPWACCSSGELCCNYAFYTSSAPLNHCCPRGRSCCYGKCCDPGTKCDPTYTPFTKNREPTCVPDTQYPCKDVPRLVPNPVTGEVDEVLEPWSKYMDQCPTGKCCGKGSACCGEVGSGSTRRGMRCCVRACAFLSVHGVLVVSWLSLDPRPFLHFFPTTATDLLHRRNLLPANQDLLPTGPLLLR